MFVCAIINLEHDMSLNNIERCAPMSPIVELIKTNAFQSAEGDGTQYLEIVDSSMSSKSYDEAVEFMQNFFSRTEER